MDFRTVISGYMPVALLSPGALYIGTVEISLNGNPFVPIIEGATENPSGAASEFESLGSFHRAFNINLAPTAVFTIDSRMVIAAEDANVEVRGLFGANLEQTTTGATL